MEGEGSYLLFLIQSIFTDHQLFGNIKEAVGSVGLKAIWYKASDFMT